MKRFINVFIMLCITVLYKAQNNPFPIVCLHEDISAHGDNHNNNIAAGTNCGNTSPYFNNNSLYLPKISDDVIYIKLNFIFLTKPDGTGNYEQNNLEHTQFLDDIISGINYRLANLGSPTSECEGYGNVNLTDTRVRVLVNKIWKVDPAWDLLQTGYNPNNGPLGGTMPLYPPSQNYYYTYLDNDASIPEGINIVFSNNGETYNDFMNGLYSNYPTGPKDQWAASESPNSYNLSSKLRQYFPDFYNKYLWMKHFVVGNPTWGSPTWETVRSWGLGSSGGFLHELGHNFDLPAHYGVCGSNIMSYYQGTRDYLSNSNISQLYRMASISNVRQYFTKDSFKNTSIAVTNNQTWDLNFRLYSNVQIDSNSSLRATCKIIMAPESRFVVRNGSNFIIEAAEISSANNSSWNGIKVEGNGYLLINPNTLIDTNNFYAYADNSFFQTGEIADLQSGRSEKVLTENAIVDKNYKIYPNPTGDFINIETQSKISKVEVYNLLNRVFYPSYNGNKVDVRSLPAGNYVLRIYTGSEVKTVNFIKK